MNTEVISPWTIYFITIADNVRWVVGFSAVCAMVVAVIFGVSWGLSHDPDVAASPNTTRRLGRLCALSIIAAIPLGLGCALTPSSRGMAAIVVIPAIANSETVQTEASEIYTLAKEWLRSQTEGATP